MRIALAALLALSASCLGQCSGVGGIANDVTFGGAWGDARPGVDDAEEVEPVVGPDWPTTPAFEFGAYLDEDTGLYADNDDVETPECRGDLCASLALTQSTLANRPTIQIPCDVGAITLPCFLGDGTDYWAETVANAAMTFLHDGTGATCYWVAEPSAASGANGMVLTTRTGSSTSRGIYLRFSSGATDRYQCSASNGTAETFNRPTGGTGLEGQLWGAACANGTARTSDAQVDWWGASPTGAEGDYSASPSSSDSATAPAIFANMNGTGPLTGHLVFIACFAAAHDDATMAAYRTVVETYLGGALPL